MRTTLLLSVLALLPLRAQADGATWYVDASMPSSGDGTSWETAFKTIQEGINAASHGDTVIVARGTYSGNLRFNAKNVTLRSTDPLDPSVVAATTIQYGAPVVDFYGTEDESCTLSGFTITGGALGIGGWGPSGRTHATIENNVVTANSGQFEGGIAACDGVIRNNVITRNHANFAGAGLAYCHGVIENNVIADNCVGTQCYWYERGGSPAGPADRLQEDAEIWSGAGLYRCNGMIRNNIIARNRATHDNWGVGWAIGHGGGLAECDAVIEGNLICDNIAEMGQGGGLHSCDGVLINNSVIGNSADRGPGLSAYHGTISNCILWANLGGYPGQIHDSTVPAYSCIQDWIGGGEGNISEDPRFLDAEKGDFRLRADSPCIDAGFNTPDLPEFDIPGMRRVMFGGKSLTVDMGAYEFYINKLDPVPGTNDAVFTWSSLADKTYSIFYTDDLFNCHTGIANFPSSGNTTTFWTDDGALTGLPPLLAPQRFYRVLENP